jgi:hypothetical protein
MRKKITKNVLEEQIMQRIYLTWFMRYIRTSRLVRVVGLALLVVLLRFWVSFGDVLVNLKGISSLSQYLTVASQNTEFAVQIILGIATVLAVMFIVDLGKAVTKIINPHRGTS